MEVNLNFEITRDHGREEGVAGKAEHVQDIGNKSSRSGDVAGSGVNDGLGSWLVLVVSDSDGRDSELELFVSGEGVDVALINQAVEVVNI